MRDQTCGKFRGSHREQVRVLIFVNLVYHKLSHRNSPIIFLNHKQKYVVKKFNQALEKLPGFEPRVFTKFIDLHKFVSTERIHDPFKVKYDLSN